MAALAPSTSGDDGTNPDAISHMFEHPRQPPVFALAVRATEYAMDQWAALARRENFKIVALMRGEFDEVPGQAAAWRRILAARHIDTIWYGDFLRRRGYDPLASHFPREGHWNVAGHRWVAEAIAEFLAQHGADYLPLPGQNVGSSKR